MKEDIIHDSGSIYVVEIIASCEHFFTGLIKGKDGK